MVGTSGMEFKSISHNNYNDTQSMGQLHKSLYLAPPDTANVKMIGYYIMQIKLSDETLNFVADYSQEDVTSETIQVGSALKTDMEQITAQEASHTQQTWMLSR